MAKRRIEKELKLWTKDPPDFCVLTPLESDSKLKKKKEWHILMYGPSDTPYENGNFNILCQFPSDYPFKPPRIEFKTKIYHMNVNDKGKICLDLLIDHWSPTATMISIFENIYELLETPDPSAFISEKIADLWIDDREEHNKIAKEWTYKYAINTNENENEMINEKGKIPNPNNDPYDEDTKSDNETDTQDKTENKQTSDNEDEQKTQETQDTTDAADGTADTTDETENNSTG